MTTPQPATKLLDDVEVLSKKYWSGSPGKQNDKDRENLYTLLGVNLERWGVIFDPNDSHSIINDKNVIEFETAAIWGWSSLKQDGKQVNAKNGYTRYVAFVQRLYARVNVPGILPTLADFKKSACEATNDNGVYRNLPKDDKALASDFMQMALTVTTTLYGRDSPEGVAATELWQKRINSLASA